MAEHDRATEKLQRTLPGAGAIPPTPARIEDARRLEKSLERLRGVRRVRVSANADGFDVSVLMLPERSGTGIENAVRSVARRLGLDPASVEVRSVGSRPSNPVSRRRLSSLSTRRYGNRFTAQVSLELEGDALVGEVDVPVGRRFEYRSVARAILESVRPLIPFALQLEHVEVLAFGAERLAVVSVSSRDDILVGSALVKDSELDAIARATLDAVNRLLNTGSVDLKREAPANQIT